MFPIRKNFRLTGQICKAMPLLPEDQFIATVRKRDELLDAWLRSNNKDPVAMDKLSRFFAIGEVADDLPALLVRVQAEVVRLHEVEVAPN